MRQYVVENLTDNGVRYFFIRDCETLDMVLLPTKYLKHKTMMNHSPNTVIRSAFAICYYFEYLAKMGLRIAQIYDMSYSKQSEHFVGFMNWIKTGRHRNENKGAGPKNKTCNAYLQEVFGFYRKKGDYWFTAEKMSRSDVSAIIDLMKDEFSHDIVISENNLALWVMDIS